MGVDCTLSLPPAARVRDVATVVGRLVGLPAVKEQLTDAWYCKVPGVTVTNTDSQPDCAWIKWDDAPFEPPGGWLLYQFEGHGGSHVILLRSWAHWIALFRAVADFFGGTVEYQDCDCHGADYTACARPLDEVAPEDGQPWGRFQARLYGLKPLTAAQVAECDQWAAYQD